MKSREGLKSSDWFIVLGCAVLALTTLGVVGERGRGRAKEAVCQANLHRWGDIFGGIVEENDGRFLSTLDDFGYWWPVQLPLDLQNWKKNRLWFCPAATIPAQDEYGVTRPGANAWGVYRPSISYNGTQVPVSPNGIAGSLGLNGYVIPIPDHRGHTTVNTYVSGVPATDGWRDLRAVLEPDNVPLFLDAMRFDLWPCPTDVPADSEYVPCGTHYMDCCCVNRHNGAVNCLFVDGSVRKVGLKELWTLKWHRSFNTAGPWTKAGGVQPEDWPEWLRPFKEY